MFTTSFVEFKTRQNELIKQAENDRLVKSFQQTNTPVSRLLITIGKVMVNSGQQLLTLSRAAN